MPETVVGFGFGFGSEPLEEHAARPSPHKNKDGRIAPPLFKLGTTAIRERAVTKVPEFDYAIGEVARRVGIYDSYNRPGRLANTCCRRCQ